MASQPHQSNTSSSNTPPNNDFLEVSDEVNYHEAQQQKSDAILLEEKNDEMGWTPLSFAAYLGFLDGVHFIITNFPNKAFEMGNDTNGSYPIHWACKGGDIKVVRAFFSKLPVKSWFLLNKRNQSILHVAAASGKTKVVDLILGYPELELMINMKDEDGNTPLHLAAMGKHPGVISTLTRDKRVKLNLQNKNGLTAFDIAQDYDDPLSFKEWSSWFSLRYAGVPSALESHYKNKNITDPFDMVLNQQQNRNLMKNKNYPKSNIENQYKQRVTTLAVVAILVFLVTFPCSFIVPSDFTNKKLVEGLATKTLFCLFIISNTLSMFTAVLALFTLTCVLGINDIKFLRLSLDLALPLLRIAIAMLSVSFTTSLYMVLHTKHFWLGVVVLVGEGLLVGFYLVYLFISLNTAQFCSRIKVLSYVCHVFFSLMLLVFEKCKTGKHCI